jgi:hypothetical protein
VGEVRARDGRAADAGHVSTIQVPHRVQSSDSRTSVRISSGAHYWISDSTTERGS